MKHLFPEIEALSEIMYPTNKEVLNDLGRKIQILIYRVIRWFLLHLA